MRLTNTDVALRPCWHPVALSAEVATDPVAVRLLGEDWVLARLGGRVAAFPDRCPHRLAPLSLGRIEGPVDSQVLRCGYHGWCFNARGDCVEIPAMTAGATLPPRAQLTPAAMVAEHDGIVFVALEAPRTEILVVPEAFGPGFLHGYLGPLRAAVGAGLMIDNFLDLTHFPFVHAATIGVDDETRFDFEIERQGLGMTVRSEHLFPNREDPAVAAGTRPLLQRRRLTYTYRAPFSVCLRIDYIEAGGTNILSFHVQPEDDESCRIYTLVARNDLDGDTTRMAEALSFEHKIVEEDLAVQERYRDKRLPLNPTVEVHIRADRATLEMRRILRDLVDVSSASRPDNSAEGRTP